MSQLLARLDQELRCTTDAVTRAEILAKKGSYLARIGKFAETRDIVSELRREFGDGHSGHATAWIMLTEALLYLYESLNPIALDRVMRSQLLGLAMKDASVIAIASAWKAHIEFETSNFDSMVKSIEVALTHARNHDHDAHARVAMVLCNSFLICGDRSNAQMWFMISRDHALKDGDQASIEALLYNRAAFSFARLRVENCLSRVDVDQLSMVRLEVASARNLQELIGVRALADVVYLCDARLMIIEGNFAAAIEALQKIRGAGPFAEYNFSQSFIDLEIAFCLLNLKRIAESLSIYKSIDWRVFDKLDIDEQLVAAWMRLTMCRGSSEFGSIDEANFQLNSLTERYEAMQAGLFTNLQPFRDH